MNNLKVGLMILMTPAILWACKKTPAEKQAELRQDMSEESRDHAKDIAEIRRDEKSVNERAKEVAEERREHAEEMTDLQKEAFLTDANRELERIDKNIEILKNKARTITGDAKADMSARIEALETKYDTLKKDVDDAKVKTGGELIRLKNSFEASLRDLEASYNELAAKVG